MTYPPSGGPWPGYPQQWPPQAPGQQPPYPQPWPPPKKNNAGLFLGIGATVVALTALVGLAFVGNHLVRSQSQAERGVVSDEQRAANAKTAQYLTDFDVVCGAGSVSNAAEYQKPYKVAAFYQGSGNNSWHTVSLPTRAPYTGDPEALSTINTVACLRRKDGTEVKSGTCKFESGGKTVNVDHYAVEYDVELHQAKSGKLLKTLGAVKGPATDCPFLVFFNGRERKVYGNPDVGAVAVKLSEFAQN